MRTVVCALLLFGFIGTGCRGHVGAGGPGAYAGAIASRDVHRGAEVYTLICAACHAGRINPDGYGWEPWRMRRQVREGNHVMPAVRTNVVTDAELEAVLAYLSVTGAVVGDLPSVVNELEPAPESEPAPGSGEHFDENADALDVPFGDDE